MSTFAAHWFGRPRLHAMARRHGPHRHGGHGPPFELRAFLHGMGPGRRSRARRGDVRAATLLLLEEEPRNGYQLMEEIESRSGGAWRPSPGSIYPALSQLEDEGLIRAEDHAGRRSFVLTDAGRSYVDENREALGTPWDEAGEEVPGDLADLRTLIGQLGMATLQVAQSGNDKQVAEAKKVLGDTRKALYGILADGD
jgi:DNA-binding PadR family transcriptional regulator